jgi:ribosomal protein S18 acetylase RimI-like enzyme
MNEIEITCIDAQHEWFPEVFALREQVLRRPLGLSLYNEDTSADKLDKIFIARHNNRVLGCLMAKPLPDNQLKLRQMAVAPEFQGTGVGRKLMLAAEEDARKEKIHLLSLHARSSAIPFYEKLGYRIDSEEFEEVGIPHKAMSKSL